MKMCLKLAYCAFSGDGARKSKQEKKKKRQQQKIKQNKTERSVWVEHLEQSFRGIIV